MNWFMPTESMFYGDEKPWIVFGIALFAQAIYNCCLLKSEKFFGICRNHANAVQYDKTRISFVSRLLFNGFPLTVFRAIISFVVNPTYANAPGIFRLWPHICIKLFKRMPLLANSYAASAIVFVVRVCFCFAPAKHTLPRLVFRHSTSPTFCESVFKLGYFAKLRHSFFCFAPAAWCSRGIMKAGHESKNNISTIADKSSATIWRASCGNFFQQNQSAVTFPNRKRLSFWAFCTHVFMIDIGEPKVNLQLEAS